MQRRVPISASTVVFAAPLATILPTSSQGTDVAFSSNPAFDNYVRQYKVSLDEILLRRYVADYEIVDPTVGDPIEQILQESQLVYK